MTWKEILVPNFFAKMCREEYEIFNAFINLFLISLMFFI